MRFSNLAEVAFCSAGLLLTAVPVHAGLIITPTFTSNINNDPNATTIKATINDAIAIYQATFSDPITVNITFQEGGGLGGSSFYVYQVSYSDFYNALVADGKTPDDAAALTRLAVDGTGLLNPVSGTDSILIKSANARALGLDIASDSDGTITLNTSLTTPGSAGSTTQYSLTAVIEHEINEILGLGSTLGLGLPSPFNADPSPEDFFRFASNGTRSFTEESSASAFYSIDGTTILAQFDNQGDGGDYGDWQSNPHGNGVPAQVQDAFATPGATPTLGVELRALDVIGYDMVQATPEPGTFALIGAGLFVAGLVKRRKSR